MTKIIGLENMTVDQINLELQRGGKFVIFQYCISVFIMTFKRPSDIYFIKVDDGTIGKSIGFSVLTFFFGWWGIPWGPIYSISSLYNNFSGGKNVTQEVLASFNPKNASPA